MTGAEPGIATLLELTKGLGPVGLVVFFGWINMRWVDKRLSEERARQDALMTQYRADVAHVSEFYKSNVVLVEQTQSLTRQALKMGEDLTEIVHLNTQVQTRLADRIEHNMTCPVATGRIDLREIVVQAIRGGGV